jgi:hypothetical protein
MRPVLRWALGAWLGLAAAGCDRVTSESLQTWKTRPDQHERLVAAAKDPKLPVPLRAEAAAALAEIGWVDRMEGAVAGMPLEERAEVILALVPRLAAQLGDGDRARAWDARDALFALRRQATTEAGRKGIDGALLPALEEDLRAGRDEGGRTPLAKMLIELGPVTVPRLLAVLADPAAPVAAASAALEKVGDKDARAQGGAALAARARAASPVPPPLWEGLGALGGPDAIAFLAERAERGPAEERERAAAAMNRMAREPALLPAAVKLAADPGAPPAAREQALEVIKRVGDDEARKGLFEVLRKERDPGFRYKALRAAFKIVRGEALAHALEALPEREEYRPEDIQEHVVPGIYEMGWENREGLYKALESKSAVARLLAVLTMEKSGFDSDADAVEKAGKDRRAVKGFPPGVTVASEAARVAAVLRKQATK